MTRHSDAPPERPAARHLALPCAAAFLAGAACVLGFAPFYAWPVPILAMAVLAFVWLRSATPLAAALAGYAFGLGLFLFGVSWVYVSLHDYGSMPAVLAALATFLFCAYLALFPAFAGGLAVRFAGASRPWRLAALPGTFVVTEWLRGTLFTGFPWLTLGASQAPASPLVGLAPYVGSYGLTLAIAAIGGLLAALLSRGASLKARGALAAAIAAIFLVAVLARRVSWTEPAGAPLAVALLQGNVSQHVKWDEDVRTKTLLDYRRMIFDARAARVIVMPETALPAFLDQLPQDYLASLEQFARDEGKDILMGTVEREFHGSDYEYFNSLVSLAGPARQSYRKRHLVPFGEYIPTGFGWVLAILKIPLSDFSRGAQVQPAIAAGGTRFGVAICYEDVFGSEVIKALPAAQVLLNVSNMAWFGDSLAPRQQLQESQMRALETGRWMVRSTNTGVTAAVDERGRVVARLPLFTHATLIANVVPRTGMTPYARAGNLPALALALALALAAALRGRFRRSGRGSPRL